MASTMHDRLMQMIADFEEDLSNEEEIGGYLAAFGTEFLIRIEDIGYQNPYLLVFHGTLIGTEDRVQLLQHPNQVNVLLRAVPKLGKEPKRIGFKGSDYSEK